MHTKKICTLPQPQFAGIVEGPADGSLCLLTLGLGCQASCACTHETPRPLGRCDVEIVPEEGLAEEAESR